MYSILFKLTYKGTGNEENIKNKDLQI